MASLSARRTKRERLGFKARISYLNIVRVMVKAISPEDLRPGHVVEVVFSIRGVKSASGLRLVRNHLSSVTIVSRKGLLVSVSEK